MRSGRIPQWSVRAVAEFHFHVEDEFLEDLKDEGVYPM